MEYVFFWKRNERYGCFSNWYGCSFTVDGIEYQSTEQYMMAEKARLFNDPETEERIMKTTSPSKIKKLGKEVKGFDSKIWDERKFEIVCKGNLEKFRQNPDLLSRLLETGDSIIVEASRDTIWGIGHTAKEAKTIPPERWGENLLGKALMWVREQLR